MGRWLLWWIDGDKEFLSDFGPQNYCSVDR